MKKIIKKLAMKFRKKMILSKILKKKMTNSTKCKKTMTKKILK